MRKIIFVAVMVMGTMRAEQPEQKGTLYQRLGGAPAVRTVVDDLWQRIVADSRINSWFAQTAQDPDRAAMYRAKLADLVCQATGGPCSYSGDMVAAHKGRGITEPAFTAVIEDLTAALDHCGVAPREKADLLKLLAPLKPAIVQPASK